MVIRVDALSSEQKEAFFNTPAAEQAEIFAMHTGREPVSDRPIGKSRPHMLSSREMIETIWRKSPWAPDGMDYGLAYALKFDPAVRPFAEIAIAIIALEYVPSFRKIGEDDYAPAYPNGLDAENALDVLLSNAPMKLAVPDELFPDLEPMGEAFGAIHYRASDVDSFTFEPHTAQHILDELAHLPSLTKATVTDEPTAEASTDRAAPVEQPKTPAAPMPRGKRPNASADDFWIEACRRVFGAGFKDQADLTSKMTSWADEHMDKPYDGETIRKKMGRLLNGIGWHQS